jgi:hypothetical protein
MRLVKTHKFRKTNTNNKIYIFKNANVKPQILVGNSERTDHLEYLGIDGRIILKWRVMKNMGRLDLNCLG